MSTQPIPRKRFWNSDMFNPILVREVRQMVRSRQIVVAVHLYLLILLGVLCAMLTNYLENPHNESFGRTLFGSVLAITTVCTGISVVLYTALKVSVDRINEDLLFFSRITPGQNTRGRWICGLVFSVLFFSISAPFLTIAYLFRGVDLGTYFFYIPLFFLVVQLVNLVAIAVFSAVRSYFQLVFYALLFLGLLCLLWLYGIWAVITLGAAIRATTRHSYYGAYISGGIPVTELIVVVSLGLLVIPITSYLFARCNLSPFSMNRMLPVRVWFTALFGILFPMSLISGHTLIGMPPIVAWAVLLVGVLAGMLVLAVCERETWEGRLRRSIPHSILLRMLVFPFYTGSINGLLWCFLWTFFMTVAVSLYTLSGTYFGGGDPPTMLFLFRMLAFLILVFCYSMTAFFLWKILLRRWIPREMIWTVTVTLIAAVSVGTVFLAFLTRTTFGNLENGLLFAPNPFLIFFDPEFKNYQILFGISWFSLIILFGYPWLRDRFLDFKPPSSEPPEPVLSEPAAVPTTTMAT